MSTLSQFGFGGGIKSIQRLTVSQIAIPFGGSGFSGSYNWPSPVTISSVDTNKTIILVNGQPGYWSSTDGTIRSLSLPSVNLTSSTSISLSGAAPVPYSFGTQIQLGTINIQVVEFN